VNHKVKCARELRARQAAVERKGIRLCQALRPGSKLSTIVQGQNRDGCERGSELPPDGQKFTPTAIVGPVPCVA
jgi:hypothetical protein